MATIIDFSPSALEIDQIAAAAGTINPNIPPPSLPTASTAINPASNRDLADAFTGNAPDILFTAEYAGAGQNAAGILVVWENFYNATHYELYSRNYLASDATWTRVLIIDANRLAQETATYTPYIENTLKLQINSNYYAICDANIAPDQIVEYKVVANYYPISATIDFETVFKSRGCLNTIPLNNTDTIFDFAQRVFGDLEYAWVVALLNLNAQYFGKAAAETPLINFIGNSSVFLPTDLNLIPKAIQESIYFFGLKATLSNMLAFTRDNSEITQFYDLVIAATSNTSLTLSYSTLQTSLKAAYPNYAANIATIQGGQYTQGVIIPSYNDTTTFNTFYSLNLMFSRLNSILIGTVFGEDTVFQKVKPLNLQPVVIPKTVLLPNGLRTGGPATVVTNPLANVGTKKL